MLSWKTTGSMELIDMKDILEKALEEQSALCHHGILGQKWGVRRYQNKDGSLTAEGKSRYLKEGSEERKRFDKVAKRYSNAQVPYNNLFNSIFKRNNRNDQIKILRKLDAYKDLSDEQLREKLSNRGWSSDGIDFWKKGVEEYIKQTHPDIDREYQTAKKEYDRQISDLYNSVKDTSFRKLNVEDVYDNSLDRLFSGKKRYERLYWNEYNRSKRQNKKSNS